MFLSPTASECAQPGGGSGREGRIGTSVERERERGTKGLQIGNLMKKREERVSPEQVQAAVI